MLTSIPCLLMRGGTSKGPFFLASDLPADPELRNEVLLAVMGSPDLRQIDGLGGGDSLTSKVAIVGPSSRPDADVDYLFAQVSVDCSLVDTAPNCGNMLAGVGPFAIERGLVQPSHPCTTLRIHNVNTGKLVEARVPTPDGTVTYDGDVHIDGVPGSGAGILLSFLDAAGTKTGRLLPTGRPLDQVEGVDVSCVDFATPMVFVSASSMGKHGDESKAELDADPAFLARLERIRQSAARKMGMGDVAGSVLPKIAMIAPPSHDGEDITSRYFTPWRCHAAHAVTGALCVAAAAVIPGTVPASLLRQNATQSGRITLAHPSGHLQTEVTLAPTNATPPQIRSAGVVRTARPLLEGVAYVRRSIWPHERKPIPAP